MSVSLRPLTIVVAAMMLLITGETKAQSLGDVAEESRAEWLIGDWSEVGNESTTIGFAWELDKHAIVVRFASGTTKARGLITYRASENRVEYVSADNQGATGTGRWVLTDGHPTLLYEQVAANGKKTSAGFVHKKIDEQTMMIEVYELNDSGVLAAKPLVSPKFTRAASEPGGDETK